MKDTQIDFPFFQRDVQDLFGEPNYDDWADQNIKNIDLSEFRPHFNHVRDYEGYPWKYRMAVNFVMEGPTRQAFGFLVKRNLVHEMHTWDGCFNIRTSKSGGFPSMHSWGLAYDFDANRNPFRPDGRLVTFFSLGFVRCFADAGFEWGGSWSTPKDPMHFQLPWIKIRSGPYAPVPFSGGKIINPTAGEVLRLTDPYMQGAAVVMVQMELNLNQDGIYGPATARAVRDFQLAAGLVPDGEVGPLTWAALQKN